LAQSLRPIAYALQNFDRNSANVVAPPTDGTEKCFVHFKVSLVPKQMAKIATKSMHNWRRYPSSHWYKIDQKCGSEFAALLWRQLTPQRKTAIYVHNYSSSCTQKYFGKFTSYMTLCAQTSFRAIFGLPV